MNRIDTERLLRRPEGQFLERKSCYQLIKGQWKLRKARDVARDVAETLSAFANSDGGTFLLGVNDDGSISGVDFPEEYKTYCLKNCSKIGGPGYSQKDWQRKRYEIYEA